MATSRPGPGIGVSLEKTAHEDTAHAVTDEMNGIARRRGHEIAQAPHVFVQSGPNRVVGKLPGQVAGSSQPPAQKGHFPTADHRAVNEDDGGKNIFHG